MKTNVWWYGPVKKNQRSGTVSKVIAFFRYLDDQNNLVNITVREVALNEKSFSTGEAFGAGKDEPVPQKRYTVRSWRERILHTTLFEAGGFIMVSPLARLLTRHSVGRLELLGVTLTTFVMLWI